MILFNSWPTPSTTPAANPSDVQLYESIMRIPRAIWERQWCSTNSYLWPIHNRSHASGFVRSLVDNGDGTVTFKDDTLAAAPTGQPDDGHYWNGTPRHADCSYQYWVGLNCTGEPPDLPYLPANYDTCFQIMPTGHDSTTEWYRDIDSRQAVRGNLVASTSQTFTVTLNVQNWITAGYITSVADLNGAYYSIITTGGLFWADRSPDFGRYPDFPNDPEQWRGSADTGKVYQDGRGYLRELANGVAETPHPNPWATEAWVGNEVLVYSGDDLKRLLITGNDDDTLFFGDLDHVPTPEEEADAEKDLVLDYAVADEFIIVAPGSRGWPERPSSNLFAFNTSMGLSVYGHGPNDEPTMYDQVRIQGDQEWFELFDREGIDCGDIETLVEADLLDLDASSHHLNLCQEPYPANYYFSPHFYKCMRHWQSESEREIGSFIERKNYTGAAEIVAYSKAKAFYDAQINHGSTTVTGEEYDVTTGEAPDPMVTTYYKRYYFTADAAYKGVPLFYEVVQDGSNGTRKADTTGTTDATSARVVVATYGYASAPDRTTGNVATDATWLGATVYYSAGWTRYHPLEFTYMYERCGFVPDTNCGVDGASLCFPPSATYDEYNTPDCQSVGTWFYQGPSQGYKTFNDYGDASDGMHGDFNIGDMIRYTGRNFHEAKIAGTFGYTSDDDTLDINFWDRIGFEGKFSETVKSAYDAAKTGTVTGVIADGSGTFAIIDETKDWFSCYYGINHGHVNSTIHTGTAVSGSTTTCVIPPTYNDTDHTDHCWIQPGRFNGDLFMKDNETVPFLNFNFEIDKSEQRVALGGENKYAGDGSLTVIGVYLAGELMDDVDGEPEMVTNKYQMIITNVTNVEPSAGSSVAPTIHFAAQVNKAGQLLVVDSTCTWRIIEPATRLHWWRGRRLKLIPPQGGIAPFEVEISYNSSTGVWIDRQTDGDKRPQVGWTYEIIEYEVGGVWEWRTTPPTESEKAERKWQKVTYVYYTEAEPPVRTEVTGYWVQPLGADPRGEDWHDDMTENEPHKSVKKYGRIVKGDYITADYIYDEMYRLLNLLVWTQGSGEYKASAVDAVPEDNSGSVFIEDGFRTPPDESDEVAVAVADYADGPFLSGATTPYSFTEKDMNEEWFSIRMGKAFAYFEPSNPSTLMAHKAQVYVYSGIDAADSEPVDIQTGPTRSTVEFNDDQTGALYHQYAAMGSELTVLAHAVTIPRILIGDADITDAPDFGRTIPVYDNQVEPEPWTDIVIAGWYPIITTTIRKWNVPGGLRYVDVID